MSSPVALRVAIFPVHNLFLDRFGEEEGHLEQHRDEYENGTVYSLHRLELQEREIAQDRVQSETDKAEVATRTKRAVSCATHRAAIKAVDENEGKRDDEHDIVCQDHERRRRR